MYLLPADNTSKTDEISWKFAEIRMTLKNSLEKEISVLNKSFCERGKFTAVQFGKQAIRR